MLESKITIIKEHLWPAGIAALAMHGLMIAAMALGVTYPEGTSPNDFRVDVMFMSESRQEKGVFTSPLVGEVDSEQREEAGEGCLFSEKKHQKRNLSAAAYPSPATPLRLRADLSHKGRGEQPQKARAHSTPSSDSHSFGEAHDVAPIFNPPPIYPYEAKRKRLQGIVLIQLFLTENGTVHKATALPPHVDPLLEDAALSAVYTWRFKLGPRTLEVPIEFKLET